MSPNYMPLSEPRPADPFGSALAGYGAMQNIQGRQSLNALAQMQMQREMETQNALRQYGQTGDPTAFRGVDPKMELALKEHLDKQTPEALKGYEKAANFIQKSRSVITPENWSGYKKGMEDQGWLPKGTLPDKVDDPTLQKILYMPELIQAHIKLMDPSKFTTVMTPTGPVKYQGRVTFDPRLRQKTPEELEVDAAARQRGKESVTGGKDYTKNLAELETKETKDVQKIDTNVQKAIASYRKDTPPSRFNQAEVDAIKTKGEQDKQTLKDSYGRQKSALQRGRGRASTPQHDPAQLQSSYQQKAQEISAMPDGPGKQTAMQQLEAWKVKYLGQ